MNVIVCGSREWKDAAYLGVALANVVQQHPDTVVHHGGCPTGADVQAGAWADHCCAEYSVAHPADWSKHGRAAGPIRNQQMVDELRPALCLAFVLTNRECRGTWDMIRRCVAAHVPVRIFSAALVEGASPV